jgi:hypothetical protein
MPRHATRCYACDHQPVRIFRWKRQRQAPVDLVAVTVGYDRTAATLLTAQCEAAGIPAQLLTMDDNGQEPGLLALTEHRLLVRRADQERVSTLVKKFI